MEATAEPRDAAERSSSSSSSSYAPELLAAATDAEASPPLAADRPRDDCGHFADDAGSLPRAPTVAACPGGRSVGNTLVLWESAPVPPPEAGAARMREAAAAAEAAAGDGGSARASAGAGASAGAVAGAGAVAAGDDDGNDEASGGGSGGGGGGGVSVVVKAPPALAGGAAGSTPERGSGSDVGIGGGGGGGGGGPACYDAEGVYSPPASLLAARTWPRVCIVGPDWPMLCVTYALIVAPTLAWLALIAPFLHAAVVAGGALSFALLALALALTAGSDPGIVPKQTEQQLALQRARVAAAAEALARRRQGPLAYRAGGAGAAALSRFSACNFCHCLRAAGTSHCYDCNCCVLELDHHCPWTGKCIGKGNLFYFYAFLTTLCAHLVLVVVTTVAYFATGRAATTSGP
jgi:hypothetical protein